MYGVLKYFQSSNEFGVKMKNKETIGLENFRKNTDKSLKFERNKTDNYLENESQSIENESDEIVTKNRQVADDKLQDSRARADEKRLDADRSIPLLDAERSRSDLARSVARNEEDQIRIEERDQKKQIAEALLNSERTDTDKNLLSEREKTDTASASSSVMVIKAEEALSIRDTYLGILSHDLKNPLTAISLSSNVIKRAFLKKDPDLSIINKYLEAIELNVSTMSRMIEDLLEVEQMVNGDLKLNLKTCNINDLIEECKLFFEPIATSKNFEIKVDSSEIELFANIDHDRILQVLSNLVGNAVKYAGTSGVITLSVIKNKDKLVVSVKDEGPGIPLEKLDVIFERFSQLSGEGKKGAGLGLFISRWIIESHKGKIFVNSVIGEGSTFSFTLPVL